jgi:hypothetical protein
MLEQHIVIQQMVELLGRLVLLPPPLMLDMLFTNTTKLTQQK